MKPKKPHAPIVIDATKLMSLPNRQCPVCLRKTLGFKVSYPPKDGHCPICDVAPDSDESRAQVALYLKMQARMLALVPKRKP